MARNQVVSAVGLSMAALLAMNCGGETTSHLKDGGSKDANNIIVDDGGSDGGGGGTVVCGTVIASTSTPIANLRTSPPAANASVTVQGVVIAVGTNGVFWVEDEAGGPNSGIYVYSGSATSGNPCRATQQVVGHKVIVQGTWSPFSAFTFDGGCFGPNAGPTKQLEIKVSGVQDLGVVNLPPPNIIADPATLDYHDATGANSAAVQGTRVELAPVGGVTVTSVSPLDMLRYKGASAANCNPTGGPVNTDGGCYFGFEVNSAVLVGKDFVTPTPLANGTTFTKISGVFDYAYCHNTLYPVTTADFQ